MPLPITILSRLSGMSFGQDANHWNAVVYDLITSWRLSDCDLFVGWAHLSLNSGKRAKQMGAKYVLDRPCPHVDFQQQLMQQEADKLGHKFKGHPQWFIQRQHQEYKNADWISCSVKLFCKLISERPSI